MIVDCTPLSGVQRNGFSLARQNDIVGLGSRAEDRSLQGRTPRLSRICELARDVIRQQSTGEGVT